MFHHRILSSDNYIDRASLAMTNPVHARPLSYVDLYSVRLKKASRFDFTHFNER